MCFHDARHLLFFKGVRIRTLVFMSGAAIIAGPKTREMVQEAYQVRTPFNTGQ